MHISSHIRYIVPITRYTRQISDLARSQTFASNHLPSRASASSLLLSMG